MSKLTVNILKDICFRHHDLSRKALKLQFLSLLKLITNIGSDSSGNDDDDVQNRASRYWPCKNVTDLIDEADQLFAQGKYLEVYELLNRIKFSDEVDVRWRLGRALFQLSFRTNQFGEETRLGMIEEAHDVVVECLKKFPDSAILHKWAAIITDRKNGMTGLEQRVRDSETVKNHLIKCCELDPKDVTAQYLLGRWCYEMSNITWFQRMLSKLLYGEPPKSSYEEAHRYLAKAEDLHPKFYLQNTYLLGKTCLKLGQYYRAKHYFEVVGNLPVHNEYEKRCAADAKKLLKRLEKYSLEKSALFYEYPFGTNE